MAASVTGRKSLPAKLRRDMAVDNLENSVLDSSANGPYAEAPRLAWLSYQREVIDEVEIVLTIAAPAQLSIDGLIGILGRPTPRRNAGPSRMNTAASSSAVRSSVAKRPSQSNSNTERLCGNPIFLQGGMG